MDRVDSIRRKYRRGEPVAAIARELGVSRDTVYKYARMEDLSPEPPKARKRKPSKMDRWAPLVDQWLTDDFRENRKQRHTAHRVWRRLVDECGADVSEQTVRRYVREARLRLGGAPDCFLDLDWPAGVAQVDFGHATFVVRGTRREMPYFVASFPYSNVGLAQAEERLSAIKFETDWDAAFGNADLVVECINENPQEKTEFYTKLAGHLPERTVILTDSSTMLPSMFAEATGRPDKYMSLHFGNQIWRNNMTELMRHDGTDPEVFELAAQFAEAIGMVPLKLNREQPGYILNSLLIPWFKAATSLVATGVCDAETVDKCWVLATGADPGQAPFRKLDKIGLVLARNILSMDPAAKDPASGLAKSVSMLNGYIDEGKTGIAAGEGFYKYESYDK